MPDLVDLQKLREMRDSGRITVEEYDKGTELLYQKSMRQAGERRATKNGAVYILLAGFLGCASNISGLGRRVASLS